MLDVVHLSNAWSSATVHSPFRPRGSYIRFTASLTYATGLPGTVAAEVSAYRLRTSIEPERRVWRALDEPPLAHDVLEQALV